MSTELIDRPREGYQLTGFYGGDARGYCLQITGDHGYVQVTREGAALLAADIFRHFLEVPAGGGRMNTTNEYHPCTQILIDGLRAAGTHGAKVLSEWDRAREKADRKGYTGGPRSDGGTDPRNSGPDRRVRYMTSSVGTTRDGYLVRQVVVECEDGTLWLLCDNEAGTDHWVRLPAIPRR